MNGNVISKQNSVKSKVKPKQKQYIKSELMKYRKTVCQPSEKPSVSQLRGTKATHIISHFTRLGLLDGQQTTISYILQLPFDVTRKK